MDLCFWRSMARFDELIYSRSHVRSKLGDRNRSPENNDRCIPKGLMPHTSNWHVSWLDIITFKVVDFRYPKNSWGASLIDNHKRTDSQRSPPFLTWENEVTKHIDRFSRFVLKIQIHESFWPYSHVSKVHENPSPSQLLNKGGRTCELYIIIYYNPF